MRLNPESVARASSRHPWRTIGVWGVVLVVAMVSTATLLGGSLTTEFDFTNNPQAKQAQAILEESRLEDDLLTETFVIAGEAPGATSDPAFVERVNEVLAELAALSPDVVQAAPEAFPPSEDPTTPLAAALGPFPSEDGQAVLFTTVLVGDIDETVENFPALDEIREEQTGEGVTVYMLGQTSSSEDFMRVSEEDIQRGESIGVFVAIIVLVIVFGAITAGVTPILVGAGAIVASLGIVGLLGQLWEFSFFVTNIVTMMGLAVGIDYSLFIVSRYREERQRGRDQIEAIGRAGATANRAVFFSGVTVVLALAGMLLVPTTIFRSLAGGAIIVVLISVAASMTLLPAILALLGQPAKEVGIERLNWPWMSTRANALVLVGLFAIVGIAAGVASAVGLSSQLIPMLVLAVMIGAIILFTRRIRSSSSRLHGYLDRSQKEHGPPGGFWDRATRGVMGRPVLSLVLSAGFLIVLSLPFWLQAHPEDEGRGFKEGFSGITTLPDDIPTKQAFDALVAYFPDQGLDSPARVVIVDEASVGTAGAEGAPGELTAEYQASVDALASLTQEDPDLGQPGPPLVSADGTVAVVDIPLSGEAADTQGENAIEAIGRLRDDYVPEAFGVEPGVQGDGSSVLVGGETAFVKDFFEISDQYTPWIIGLVLLLSFILLTVVFRSLVVPAKAIVMNLLSVGAAYGAIVLVFQKGDPNGNLFDRLSNSIGEGVANVFGFTRVDAIEAWLPLFLFSILFGLSMDYHVFLLTRIREEYDKTGDNAEAVAFGLRTTGGIITGAAIIMVAVFAGFAAGRLTSLEQMGFGLALAVLIDATVVRSILVPSTMRLLGDRNWYLPGWLQWLPKIDVEGHEAAHVRVPDSPAELVEAGERGDGA